jgi:hypothetical protein
MNWIHKFKTKKFHGLYFEVLIKFDVNLLLKWFGASKEISTYL